MRVVFVTHYTGLYGANKALLEVVINMKSKYGIIPIVIVPDIGEFNKELDYLNIENYTFKYYGWVYSENDNKIKSILKKIRYIVYNGIARRKISKFIKNKNIDLIHTNSSVIDIGAKISKKLNIKHIWHLREFGKEDYNLLYYKKFSKAASFIEDNSDKIICISRVLKDKYIDQIKNKNKWKLIYDGIQTENYLNDISAKDYNNGFNIIFTGLIMESKNQMELLKAVEILVNERNKKDIKVYYLGDGEQYYIDKMKKFCYKNKLENNVLFEGRVKNVREYISKSDVGVICSAKEAFGRVTVEYMMGGLAVIASNTGANVEIIQNNINGLLYEIGNVEQLSNKLEELYNDREKLKQLAIKGQKHALCRFTSDVNCENIYKTYKEVCQ